MHQKVGVQIVATLVFGCSPHDKKESKRVEAAIQFYDEIFGKYGFSCDIYESVHFDECDKMLPEAASIEMTLTQKDQMLPTLYNLLKIVESSLLLFPHHMEVKRFSFELC